MDDLPTFPCVTPPGRYSPDGSPPVAVCLPTDHGSFRPRIRLPSPGQPINDTSSTTPVVRFPTPPMWTTTEGTP